LHTSVYPMAPAREEPEHHGHDVGEQIHEDCCPVHPK
jgi:hypothetical protein